MKRMIDAEKFLDKLLYMGYMDEQKSEVEEVANNMIEEAIPKADYETRLKAEWNPFDSTIPLEDGDYLVTYEDPQTHKLQVLIARYHMAEHEEDECRFYDDTGIEITLAVKAWQPLPEPYMEDD